MAKMLEEKSLSTLLSLPLKIVSMQKMVLTQGRFLQEMLKDFGVKFCILGHSERRTIFGESEQSLAKKIEAVLAEDIAIIYCRENNNNIRLA